MSSPCSSIFSHRRKIAAKRKRVKQSVIATALGRGGPSVQGRHRLACAIEFNSCAPRLEFDRRAVTVGFALTTFSSADCPSIARDAIHQSSAIGRRALIFESGCGVSSRCCQRGGAQAAIAIGLHRSGFRCRATRCSWTSAAPSHESRGGRPAARSISGAGDQFHRRRRSARARSICSPRSNGLALERTALGEREHRVARACEPAARQGPSSRVELFARRIAEPVHLARTWCSGDTTSASSSPSQRWQTPSVSTAPSTATTLQRSARSDHVIGDGD